MYLYYIAHLDGLQELWMKKIDINLPAHGIAKALAVKYDVDAADLTSILLNTYMLTGSDTVSYLYKRGKKSAPTKQLLIIWLTSCPYADTVTLKKA